MSKNCCKKTCINQFRTDKSPEGIVSGFGGVMVTTEDLLKIGILYQQKGMWNSERLLTEEWCDLALGLKNVYENSLPLNYAFHWDDMGGIYSAGGRFGQSVLIVPRLNMVVAITGSVASRRYQSEYSAAIQEKVLSPITLDGKLEYDGRYADVLRKKGEHFSVVGEARVTSSPLAAKINGKTFVIADNKDGVTEISLSFNDDSVIYTMKDARGVHTVQNGIGYWKPGTTTMTGNYLHHQYQNPEHPVYAAAEWLDDATLKLTWQFTDMPFCDYLIIKLTDNAISMARSVNVNSSGPFGGQERPTVTGKMR